jgi:hypothetical protein
MTDNIIAQLDMITPLSRKKECLNAVFLNAVVQCFHHRDGTFIMNNKMTSLIIKQHTRKYFNLG